MNPKKKKKSKEQRAKMLKTSIEIIKRIQFDPDLSPYQDHFSIDYLDRFDGILNINLEGYLLQSDIPQHRIYFIKFRDRVIWDREKRKDLVSDGAIYELIELFNNGMMSEGEESDSDDDSEEDESEDMSEDESIEQIDNNEADKKDRTVTKIIFSNRKKRKIYQQYVPEDTLESWMLKHNQRDEEFVLNNPTHISQKGGYYHISSDLMDELYSKWVESIAKSEVFFMEEVRTSKFRLYIDLDIKLTQKERFDLIESEWLSIIQQFTLDYFSGIMAYHELDTSCIVLECHSDWKDATSNDAVFKSGFRIYYPNLHVNAEQYGLFLKALSLHMEEEIEQYKNQPSDWRYEDIIDVKSATHDRNRMYGTVKFRRGSILPRVYSYLGSYDENAQFSKVMNDKLDPSRSTGNLLRLVQNTSVRLPDL